MSIINKLKNKYKIYKVNKEVEAKFNEFTSHTLDMENPIVTIVFLGFAYEYFIQDNEEKALDKLKYIKKNSFNNQLIYQIVNDPEYFVISISVIGYLMEIESFKKDLLFQTFLNDLKNTNKKPLIPTQCMNEDFLISFSKIFN